MLRVSGWGRTGTFHSTFQVTKCSCSMSSCPSTLNESVKVLLAGWLNPLHPLEYRLPWVPSFCVCAENEMFQVMKDVLTPNVTSQCSLAHF